MNINDPMKRIPIFFLLTFLLTGASQFTCGQDYIEVFSRDYTSELSVELDPVAFLLRGYSLHLRYRPMFSERFLIGVGTYGMDVPDVIVNLNRDNRDKGWEARIRGAFQLYGELYARKGNAGWFLGEQIGLQSFRVSNRSEPRGATTFATAIAVTYAGYSWRPRKSSFYLKPWAGIGVTGKIDGINSVGSMRYNVGPFTPFVTCHAGYSF